MKRISAILLAFLLCTIAAFPAFAADDYEAPTESETQTEEKQNTSQPRFMVTAYDTGGNITPSGKSTLKVTIKNQSKDKKIQNIKLAASEDSGEIIISGTGTQYVQSVKAGGTYTWNLEITATKAAQAGIHKIAIASEYEDEYGTSYSASDSLPITVSQPAELDFSSAQLPASVYQGDTQTLALNLMNTGKGKISNCKIDFESDSMNSGGTVFIGDIAAGESKSANLNLRIAADKLGNATGTIKIYCENELGESVEKTAEISTSIEEKPQETNTSETEKKEKKNPLWWLFALCGAAAGGLCGWGIPTAIRARKQRKEDELRL
ncbi:MAG: CARDB domain-containing protein [Eubacterium sp.]|nr:CARDB domain-containing protein [Eubacterium sp.]